MLKELLKEAAQKTLEVYKVKPTKNGGLEMVSDGKYYPTLYLSSKDVPELKDWEIDEDYTIVLKVTQRSKSMNTEDKKEVYSSSLDIKEIGVLEDEEDNSIDPIKKLYGA